ncbi:DUF5979 domain-containing protein [Arthrobacter alpinus]|nr:DUF5979 domain-containing protein [Arthrobacter alpinus]
MAASLVLLGMGTALPAQAAELPASVGTISKSNDLSGKPLVPGQEFKYEILVTCAGITAECVNYTVTDQLPPGLEMTSLPQSTDTQIVSYDVVSGLLTVEFKLPLQHPAGTVGLPAGSPVSFELGMRLPLDSELLDGDTVSNTAVGSGDNFPDVQSTSDIIVSVPKVITPVATKSWSDGSAVAGTGEASTITLGVRNESTSSANVTSLSVTDDAAATFENFNFTSAAVESFPKGADTATLRVKTTAGWVDGGSLTAAGTFALPAGINPTDVIGTEVTFTNTAGAKLPYDATGGTVKLGMELRDTLRSTGAPLAPATKLTVNNCATPSAAETGGTAVSGTAVCAPYQVLPDTVIITGSKKFFADENGDWSKQNNEHAVQGQPSGVTATVDATNGSPFPVKEIVIIEPDPESPGEMDKVDLETVRFRPPAGATSVTLTVGYSSGAPVVKTYTIAELAAQGGVETILRSGSDVTQVKVSYSGVDTNGNPSIAEGAKAGLDLHGKLNDKVTADDVTDGIANCAAVKADDGRVDGQGTASGKACQSLPIEPPRTTGQGVKDVGQTSVPMGQPIPFTLNVKNNGNIAMANPVITDPPMNPDGTLMDGYANPFEQLKITAASISKAAALPNVAIELYVNGAWVPYVAGDANVADAKGVRATMAGSLPPGSAFTLNLVTERRPGIAESVTILNCFATGSGGVFTPGDPACAPAITTGPQDSAAALNKNIQPGTLPEYVPGLPTQYADVSVSIRNTGNLSAKTLRVTDADADFFDAVDFSAVKSVKFPKGANRVQIDVLTPTGWVVGTPSDKGILPAGVNPANVRGFQATFSHSSNGFVVTPCKSAAANSDTECIGTVAYTVSPRQTLRSNPAVKVPAVLENTASGQYWTTINAGGPVAVGEDVKATLTLTKGSSQLAVDKTPDTVVSAGAKAPFYLKVSNTGTGNLTGLNVKDMLPPGISFDETFVGDNGLPYKIRNVQIPASTPVLPTPAFIAETTGERVSALLWDFGKNADGSDFLFAPGSTFVIEIQVTLAPGSNAGDLVKNTMGATSTNPDLVCKGTEDADNVFGEGTYCIDSAQLTVKAGAFFQSRKWVAGTPSLGWYNTLTKAAVPVGGATCPAIDAGGVKYTAYPCVALVNPGDNFKYILRLVNSGTEAGTDMRVIDTFPSAGDKGIVGGQDRGTEWDKRPTLASEPKLTGPGTMTTLYSDKAAVCSKDLAMGGAGSTSEQCATGDWAAAYGPGVTAAQFRLAFDPKIGPGGLVDISFEMKSPMDVTAVSDPTVAWNSFAHAETTDRNGSPHVLPPTEPIKVGVALAYGDLTLVKKIGQNPSNLPVAGAEFTFHVTCEITPVGGVLATVWDKDYKVTSLAEVKVTGIPANSSCKVWEVDALGGFTDHGPEDPLTFVIKPGLGAPSVETATITNDFPDAVVALEKIVTGAAAQFAQDTYPMDLFCTFQGRPVDGYSPKKIQVPANDNRYVTAVPPGSRCHVVETDNGGATEVTYLPAKAGSTTESGSVTTASGNPVNVQVTNDFRAGSLSVNKETTGAGAPELAQGPFTFNVLCSFNGVDGVVDKTITILQGKVGQTTFTSEELTGLPAGASCVVTETDNGGADYTPDPVTVVVPDSDNAVVGFTGENANTFSAGTIGLAKVLDGDAASEDYATNALFSIMVTCQRDAVDSEGNPIRTTVLSQSVDIKGGETVAALMGADGKPVKLPVGTHCFGEETNAGGATSSSVDHNSFETAAIVEVQEDASVVQEMAITATNTFDYGQLELSKKLDGAAAGYVGEREFTLALTCQLDQGAEAATAVVKGREFTIKGGESITVEKLPVGAGCWVAETEAGGASSVSIDHNDAATAAVVGAEGTVTLTVANTFDAGLLTVSKKVVNGGAGPYSFELVCTTGQGAVALAPGDAAFNLKGGESRTVSVPNGAACAVTERDVPAGAAVTYTASSGSTDGTVAVATEANVQVTNTFKVAPVVADPGMDVQLGNTGANGIAGISLAAVGAMVLGMILIGRRRAKVRP